MKTQIKKNQENIKNKKVICKCIKCNKPFSSWASEDLCKSCRNKELERKNQVVQTCTCTQCNREFTIKVGEVEFYESRNLVLPKRCKDCRDSRRLAQEN